MQINLWSEFFKRENSTKLPVVTADKVLTGYLKEPCSVENPIFKIERLPTDICPEIYVYAYIQTFSRYYFVDDWIWVDGLWECHLKEDYLGSWKTQIGLTEAYIERSAEAFNPTIQDKLYPTNTDFEVTNVDLDSMYYRVAPSGGCYVLGIINNWNFSIPQAGGAVTYYAMTIPEMRNLMQYLMSDTFIDDAGFPLIPSAVQQLLHTTAKAFINPIQYITSCMWFPYDVEDIAEAQPSNIVLGFWELEMAQNNIDGHKLESFVTQSIVEETIPYHPQFTRGSYLNYAPYTRINLYLPPFGTIPIDTSYLSLGHYLVCRIYIDMITGKAQLRVFLKEERTGEENNCVIAERTAMFGIPIQLAQVLPDYLGGLTGAINIASSIDKGFSAKSLEGDAIGALMTLGSIGNTVDNMMPQVSADGVSGAFIQNVLPPCLTVEHIKIVEENLAEQGRPLCDIRRINTLPGYIKCGEVSIDIPCFLSEKRAIHAYLMNGFFWE